MREEGIAFQQCANAFLKCAHPARLQELADSLTAHDLLACGRKWLSAFTAFFTERKRKHAGCHHRLFFAQVELCDNLIFRRRAALDRWDTVCCTPIGPSDSASSGEFFVARFHSYAIPQAAGRRSASHALRMVFGRSSSSNGYRDDRLWRAFDRLRE
jgi:hypothetical protein